MIRLQPCDSAERHYPHDVCPGYVPDVRRSIPLPPTRRLDGVWHRGDIPAGVPDRTPLGGALLGVLLSMLLVALVVGAVWAVRSALDGPPHIQRVTPTPTGTPSWTRMPATGAPGFLERPLRPAAVRAVWPTAERWRALTVYGDG